MLWSRNFVSAPAPTFKKFRLRLDNIYVQLPFVTDFILKSGFFMFFMKEYQPNSHAGSYKIWIFIFIYYLSWPGARAGSQSQADPEPKLRYSGSGLKFRLQLHNIDHLIPFLSLIQFPLHFPIFFHLDPFFFHPQYPPPPPLPSKLHRVITVEFRQPYLESVEWDAKCLGLPVDNGKLGAHRLPGEGVHRLFHLHYAQKPSLWKLY